MPNNSFKSDLILPWGVVTLNLAYTPHMHHVGRTTHRVCHTVLAATRIAQWPK